MLVRQLPPQSCTISALAAEVNAAEVPEAAVPRLWSVDQQLLASTVDALAVLQWTVAQSNSRDRIPPPTMLPRPGAPVAGRRPAASPDQIARIRARNSGKDTHNGN